MFEASKTNLVDAPANVQPDEKQTRAALLKRAEAAAEARAAAYAAAVREATA
jgi:hypothetical protein